ncbi:4Fe-4S dicluster domain-containing protein [Candidatus Bathyarchaeota archaeon]|nr:4Fe-4S dicluster domain-containing protein [Candidatus Bathyarchaeota archaeon]
MFARDKHKGEIACHSFMIGKGKYDGITRYNASIPPLVDDMPIILSKDNKNLYLQQNRCQGCSACVVACPTGVLGMSNQLNMRLACIPRVLPRKEDSCVLCHRCELACPAWAIYLIERGSKDSTHLEGVNVSHEGE